MVKLHYKKAKKSGSRVNEAMKTAFLESNHTNQELNKKYISGQNYGAVSFDKSIMNLQFVRNWKAKELFMNYLHTGTMDKKHNKKPIDEFLYFQWRESEYPKDIDPVFIYRSKPHNPTTFDYILIPLNLRLGNMGKVQPIHKNLKMYYDDVPSIDSDEYEPETLFKLNEWATFVKDFALTAENITNELFCEGDMEFVILQMKEVQSGDDTIKRLHNTFFGSNGGQLEATESSNLYNISFDPQNTEHGFDRQIIQVKNRSMDNKGKEFRLADFELPKSPSSYYENLTVRNSDKFLRRLRIATEHKGGFKDFVEEHNKIHGKEKKKSSSSKGKKRKSSGRGHYFGSSRRSTCSPKGTTWKNIDEKVVNGEDEIKIVMEKG